MSALHDFQADMSRYLTSPPGPDVPQTLQARLQPVTVAQTGRRFAIYKNNYYARLVDALRDTFPVVERLVGDEFFRYAAVQYVAGAPPVSATLLGYGAGFPDFLSASGPAQSVPYLADVARLEKFYLEAYHAEDREPIARLAVPCRESRTGLTLHPSARLMSSPFQVSRIWELNRRCDSFDDIELAPQREFLLIIRPTRAVEVRRLRPGTYSALQSIVAGRSIQAALEKAARDDPQFIASEHFTPLIDAGTFSGVTDEGTSA